MPNQDILCPLTIKVDDENPPQSPFFKGGSDPVARHPAYCSKAWQTLPAKSGQQGVILIEAMIAILIFSMGVLAIVGLQAAMIKNTTDSKYRADASHIAQKRIGEMWSDPANAALGVYLEANTDISTLLPMGTRTVTQPVAGQFVVTITWQQPGQGEVQHNLTTTATITGG